MHVEAEFARIEYRMQDAYVLRQSTNGTTSSPPGTASDPPAQKSF